MKLFVALSILLAINFIAAELNVGNKNVSLQNSELPFKGAAVDEVVVQSSLMIKPKQQRPHLRRVRRTILGELKILKSLIKQQRVKRQVGKYSRSQAAANAVAFQNYNVLYGFGNSAANAQAQAFNVQGPTAGLEASAAGSVTQTLDGNNRAVQNLAGASDDLVFNLSNGKSVKFASTNSFAKGPHDNNANSRSNAVSVNRF